MLWHLDYRALWPYSDWFRLAPVILDAYVKFLEGVCIWLVLLLQVVASILAGVHWPQSLVVAGESHLLVMLLEAARTPFSDQIARCAGSRCS